ncbi:MAG: DUF1284 domain-containing protein [Candidatus Paracaedimonas acanthamoebae]|uniref:DUF1284 domain-containing protein n=1 Tax=Candidatus Paracaedimonas acanthamoebae TaxID=244581 RepID=A0A8J7PSE6_9PROT|nr:DUF1284 domain-containing protein [Candidatus Paracaedimonas acanthamoebae]
MLNFRPHHFLCTIGFVGEGYSPNFVKNYAKIVNKLEEDENTSIRVHFGTDSICAACPGKLARDLCMSQKKIDPLDDAHAKILELKNGEILTWKQAKGRLIKKMTFKAFHQACKRCNWKKLGVCETALRSLKSFSKTEKYLR